MGIRNRLYRLCTDPTLFIFYTVVLASASAILVDVDCPIRTYLGKPEMGRFLMPYFEVAGHILICCGIVLLIACLCRYAWIRILRAEHYQVAQPKMGKTATMPTGACPECGAVYYGWGLPQAKQWIRAECSTTLESEELDTAERFPRYQG